VIQEQVVTITFFKFDGFKDKWWALKQMKKARQQLSDINSLHFHKLLGSGSGNGFSLWPDFSVYAFLGVWNSYHAARKALLNFPVFLNMQARASHQLMLYMQSVRAKGSWNQLAPFNQEAESQAGEPIAVITRASIAPGKLFSFWKNVPSVSKALRKIDGMAFSKGIGEIPLLEQATFSIWKNRKTMVNYAYRGKKHREMIKKTQQLGWYSEELFAEFKILRVEQNWPGLDISILRNSSLSLHPSINL
jgi:hypothetical protein